GHQIPWLTDDFEAVIEVVDLLGARFENRGQHVVLSQAVLHQCHQALAGEQVGHRAGVGHVPTVAGHRDAHLAGGAVAVIGQALDQPRAAVGSVALVGDGLVVGATGLLACATLAGPLDVVVGHRVLLGLLDGVVQRGVTAGVAATDARGHLDVLDQSSEVLAAAGVDNGLLVLGGSPLGMAAHAGTALFLALQSPNIESTWTFTYFRTASGGARSLSM